MTPGSPAPTSDPRAAPDAGAASARPYDRRHRATDTPADASEPENAGRRASAPEAFGGPAARVTDPDGPAHLAAETAANAAEDAAADAALAPIYARGDRWMAVLVGLHGILALALATVHDTWPVTLVVTVLFAGAFYACWWRRPGRFVTRATAGVALQAFCALHIHQMNGLAEMHFFYFTSVTAMILYQDWRAMWPGIAAIIAQHTLFSVWHNAGANPGGHAFFEPAHVSAGKLAWHYGLALVQSGIASYAAVVLRGRTLAEAAQRVALAAQADDLAHANRRLQDQTAELAAQADALSEQAAELEITNDQLHEQQVELETQAEALALHSTEAESARAALSATLERVGDAFFALDREWRFTYVNRQAETLLGQPAPALLGRIVWDAFPDAVNSTFWREYHHAMGTGAVARFEEFFPPLDRWFAVAAHPGPDGLSVFFQDVTERRAMQRRLREAEERFRVVQDASPDGFMLFESVRDGDGRIVDFAWLYTNPAAERLVGHTHAALVGRRLLDVMPGNRTDGLFDAYARVVETGEPMRREFHYAHEGLDHWIANTAVKVNDGFGVTFADITARKRAEADIAAAREAAEDANRAKSQFLASMSHELRTPLNAIGGYAELLELGIRGETTPAQREDLARIRKSQRHLLGLINDILNFAKLEAGRVEFDLGPVDVADVVRDVVPLVTPQLRAKGLALTVAVPEGTRVWADREKLAQVVLNLLSNALKFTPAANGGAPGAVAVELVGRAEAEADDGVGAPNAGGPSPVWLRVRDNGVGIPREQQEAVFDPFVQVPNAVAGAKAEGTGLGLAISRDLMRGMQGDLRVRSEPGVGSAFTVTLRRCGAPANGVAPVEERVGAGAG